MLPSGDVVELFDDNLPERLLFERPVLGFEVDNVVEAREEMEARGIAFLQPTSRGTGGEWAYFRTPDGNVCQIMGKKR